MKTTLKLTTALLFLCTIAFAQQKKAFATKSKVVSWLVGGLNFQVEHHLFPKISHVHYPVINKFVRETCKQFNVKYIENKTFVGALWSHIKYLKKLGVN